MGLFCPKPWFTELISVFRNRDATNIVMDNPIVTEFRILLTVSVGCCLFDRDAIKSWINISPVDQTKFFQLRTALLWESAYGCMTTRRLTIQWSQKILTIDIITSWKLLWDQRPQAIRILHEWNTKTTHFESKSHCPRVSYVQQWRQITKSTYTNNTDRSNLANLNTVWALLLTRINCNPSMDK